MPPSDNTELYRDDHLLIVAKRAGELVVAADGHGPEPLYDRLHAKEPGLTVVHRLDFGTSGVVVFARTAEAGRVIREGKFQGWTKTYVALVHGVPEPRTGVIRLALKARTRDVAVPAVTRYSVRRAFGHAYAVLELIIDTGRKHQIRQHCAMIRHPLVLDPVYGDPRRDRVFKQKSKYRRLFLHAWKLEFPHPITGEPMSVEAPMPKAFQECLERMQGLGEVKKTEKRK
jgi:RluA family pseudouridine synthase